MSDKIIELAYLRNKLASEQFNDEDNILLHEVETKIAATDSIFRKIAINAIENCKLDIKKCDFKAATQEIQFIHNFCFYNSNKWNSDYFYKVELLSYLEQVEDLDRIRRTIQLVAEL